MLRTTVFSAVAMVFCAWIVQSSRYLPILNGGGVGFGKFLKFTSYLSTDIFAAVLPMALAISAAFVYHRLKESNQLTALQAAGFSPLVTLIPLAYMTAIVTGGLYFINAQVSPYAWRQFRSLEFKIRNNLDPPEKAGEIFSGNGFSVYAQKYVGDLCFENLFLADTRNQDKICGCFAASGIIRDNVLILTEGERTEIDFKNRKNSVIKFRSHNYDLKEILKIEKKSLHPNEKYLDELLIPDADESVTKTQTALFHQKITSPLLAIIFALLSFITIAAAPYSRKSSLGRIVMMSAIILTFQGVYFWIANVSAKNPEYIPLNYVLTIASLIGTVVLIARRP
jgi:lipopolysaccharide export system permease protein